MSDRRPDVSTTQLSTDNPDNPLDEALARLKQSDNLYRHADAELRKFIKQNMCVIDGISRFRGDSIQSGQQLRDKYIHLSHARDKARREFMQRMEEWATVKTGRTFRVGVLEQ